MSDKVYGIDLGTTYSAIALVNDGVLPNIVKNFLGDDTTASVVYFNEDGTVVVGSQAKHVQVSDPENACSLIKRHIGTEYLRKFRGQVHTPESISALILKELVSNANSQNGLDITKAVITVPAYFGIQERQATKQAGEIAGLEVVGIIPEPVAAAISLGTRQEEEQTFLIFDLGGGTFDTTILNAKAGSVDVIAIDGNRLLGGADWDACLESVYLEKFKAQAGLGPDKDPSQDEEFMTELRLSVEEAKKMLTKLNSWKLLLRYEDKKENVEVTREEFEAAAADLVTQTIEITKRVVGIAQKKVPGLTIDRLLLVGGSSRMPMIETALTDAGFAWERTDYDLSVAKGAAIYGQGEVPWTNDQAVPARTVVTNVLSRGLGVQLVKKNNDGAWVEYIEFLAHAQERIPLDPPRVLEAQIIRDGQQSVECPLFEQEGNVESPDPKMNKPMASGVTTTISGLPPMNEGDPIQVHLEVSDEGIATLVVIEPSTGSSFRAEAAVAVLSNDEQQMYTEQVAEITTSS
ncbi:MAG: Hsp70 family protein [Propionibacteriaceae bacterium]|jgi:molecular chaperone DnaK (HSP70)|nr:Hsp70 family protein [Propionibacteriaceae bacterium]